jgi:hypothetical protein
MIQFITDRKIFDAAEAKMNEKRNFIKFRNNFFFFLKKIEILLFQEQKTSVPITKVKTSKKARKIFKDGKITKNVKLRTAFPRGPSAVPFEQKLLENYHSPNPSGQWSSCTRSNPSIGRQTRRTFALDACAANVESEPTIEMGTYCRPQRQLGSR